MNIIIWVAFIYTAIVNIAGWLYLYASISPYLVLILCGMLFVIITYKVVVHHEIETRNIVLGSEIAVLLNIWFFSAVRSADWQLELLIIVIVGLFILYKLNVIIPKENKNM